MTIVGVINTLLNIHITIFSSTQQVFDKYVYEEGKNKTKTL